MSIVVQARRPRFSTADLAMFREIFTRLSRPFRWAEWELETTDEGDCERIAFVNPEDWMFLTLLRSADGRYHAHEDEGDEVAQADTFEGLLAELGLMEA